MIATLYNFLPWLKKNYVLIMQSYLVWFAISVPTLVYGLTLNPAMMLLSGFSYYALILFVIMQRNRAKNEGVQG